MSDENMEKPLSKEEHMINYAKALHEVEQAIIPYREHKTALKQSYKDNGWLTKNEMSQVLRAYRMLKKDEDVEDLVEIFKALKGNV
jgi:hypothetical protein